MQFLTFKLAYHRLLLLLIQRPLTRLFRLQSLSSHRVLELRYQTRNSVWQTKSTNPSRPSKLSLPTSRGDFRHRSSSPTGR